MKTGTGTETETEMKYIRKQEERRRKGLQSILQCHK
jgi:hypothetical protein